MKTDVFTLAHEIKNPLCVARGYLDMLNDSNLDRYKEIIQKEIANSLEVLDNYLEYKKIVINKEIMDINLLLLDIKKSLREYLKFYKVKLVINVLDDDIYLMGDYNKLKQVFNNIVKNSMEAFAKTITIDYKIKNGKIIICIKDDGMGIKTSDFDKIGTNYSSKVMGNGIGVNLSKKIIKLHNGKLEYKNNPDQGISAYITLLLD